MFSVNLNIMSSSSLISIVIPVFNRKELVKVMLNSILAQSYQNWELLLVDDGSTDGTLELLYEYSVLDSRIIVHNRERLPKGAPTCRNIGLEYSKGIYIMFLDSDDWLPDFTFMQRVECMEENGEADFAIFPSVDFYDSLGDGKHFMGIDYGEVLKHLVDGHLPFTVCTNIYKLEFLKSKNIIWDEALMSLQDADFNIQCILKGGIYIYAPVARIDYYIRIITGSNSISQTIRKGRHMVSHLYFLNKLAKSLPASWIEKNRWAIRRRIVFVYTWANGTSDIQIEELKKWVQGTDASFSKLFNISICFHSFLTEKLSMNYSKYIPLAFPYYSLYNKIYSFIRKRRIKKKMIKVVR